MTHPAVDGEPLDDFVARISDVLRFVFAQRRNDIVVFVGEDGIARELLPQSQPQPRAPTLPAGRHDAPAAPHHRNCAKVEFPVELGTGLGQQHEALGVADHLGRVEGLEKNLKKLN